jgi:thioredoxin-related protein
MIAFAQANSQNFILPTKIVDSLIFEVKKGRSCDTLQQKQLFEIKTLRDELIANGKVIKLKTTENEQLSFIISTLNTTISLSSERSEIEKEKLKTRIRHLWAAILSEGAIIVLLILII